MTAGRAKAPLLCIQHAICGNAIFFGGQTQVRLDLFRREWMFPQTSANVLHLNAARRSVAPPPSLRIPMPANDNLAPLR